MVQDYLAQAASNELEHIRNNGQFLSILDRASMALGELVTGRAEEHYFVVHLLLMNGHLLFLAAIRAATGGACIAAFPLIRGCLESGLYALIAAQSRENAAIWLNREKDRAACQRLYRPLKALSVLASLNPSLKDHLQEQYTASIDYGAHPNRHSILAATRRGKMATGQNGVWMAYLHSAPSRLVTHTNCLCI